jgi:hypothetical protein
MTMPEGKPVCYIERPLATDGMAINFWRMTESGGERGTVGALGYIEWGPTNEGMEPDGNLLLMNHWESEAFWGAIEKRFDPPTESKALREALALERGRVDLVLGRLLDGMGTV